MQCQALQVSVAGYHEHFVRRGSSEQRRHLSDDALLVDIEAVYAETRNGYSSPRTWKELLARDIRIGKERVWPCGQETQDLRKWAQPLPVLGSGAGRGTGITAP